LKKLIILQSIVPDYGKLFFGRIKDSLHERFILYSGDSYFESSLKNDESIERIKVRNYFLFKKLLIQSHFIKLIFIKGDLVLEMNPRILTNWIILIFRKLFLKKTLLWGHAWSRGGKDSKTEYLRKIMKSLGDAIIVYTNKQKTELLEQFPNKTVLAAPNAVISSSKMISNFKIDDINNFIFVGRLTEFKKPLILVKAFHLVLNKLPKESNLVILGSGDQKSILIDYVQKYKLKERVHIKGHVSSYEELKKYYHSSLFSVSPGYVGLSITQSFGFGVPMLVSKNENHSPEIEAFKDKVNGLYFKTDNTDHLGEILLDVFKNKEDWIQKRKVISDLCKETYSIESMAKTFIDLIR